MNVDKMRRQTLKRKDLAAKKMNKHLGLDQQKVSLDLPALAKGRGAEDVEDSDSSSGIEDFAVVDNQIIKMQSNESQVLLTKYDPNRHNSPSDVLLVASGEKRPSLAAQGQQTKHFITEPSSDNQDSAVRNYGESRKTKYEEFVDKQAQKE